MTHLLSLALLAKLLDYRIYMYTLHLVRILLNLHNTPGRKLYTMFSYQQNDSAKILS